VIETLESAKAQTYQNIELIVSDDCSTDKTVEICRNWIEKNGERFRRTELITVTSNTGIPANCNRGLAVAKGVWVKFIAGDDVLTNDCIEVLMDYVKSNPSIRIVQSNIDHYRDFFNAENFIITRTLAHHKIADESITPLEQYSLLLKGCHVNAPGTLIQKDLLYEMGGFDERFHLEDWPLWLKITKARNKIFYLNKSTVKYRVHSSSISINKNNSIIFGDFYLKMRPFYKEQILPNVSFWDKMRINYIFFVKLTFDKCSLNRNNLPLKMILNLLLLNYTAFRNYKP